MAGRACLEGHRPIGRGQSQTSTSQQGMLASKVQLVALDVGAFV
jgi:hypothetical protein